MIQSPWYKSAIGRFRVIAVCEGISFLILLLIAMPLKYLAGLPQYVLIAGWIHGFLFVTYMISGLNVKTVYKWNIRKTMLAIAASVIPLGPFILDRKILSKEAGSMN
jgi:integral membrane protein